MDYTEIILAVIGLLGTVVTVVLVPYIKSKTTNEQQTEIATWVKIAVACAEQIFTGTKLGKEKYEYVISFLKGQGINVNDKKIISQINVLIEAFVAEMNSDSIILNI